NGVPGSNGTKGAQDSYFGLSSYLGLEVGIAGPAFGIGGGFTVDNFSAGLVTFYSPLGATIPANINLYGNMENPDGSYAYDFYTNVGRTGVATVITQDGQITTNVRYSVKSGLSWFAFGKSAFTNAVDGLNQPPSVGAANFTSTTVLPPAI